MLKSWVLQKINTYTDCINIHRISTKKMGIIQNYLMLIQVERMNHKLKTVKTGWESFNEYFTNKLCLKYIPNIIIGEHSI